MTNDNISISNQIPLLTFNSLYGLLREEKKSKVLQKLPNRFYDAISNFFQTKSEEIKKLKLENSPNLSKEQRVFRQSQKITEELLNLRLGKISISAVKSGIFIDETFLPQNLLDEETDFFEKLSKESQIIRKRLL